LSFGHARDTLLSNTISVSLLVFYIHYSEYKLINFTRLYKHQPLLNPSFGIAHIGGYFIFP